MDVNTFSRWVDLLSFDLSIITGDDFLKHIGGVFNFIEGPLLGLSLSGNLLLHGCEETLAVEETGHPEGWRSLLADPAV